MRPLLKPYEEGPGLLLHAWCIPQRGKCCRAVGCFLVLIYQLLHSRELRCARNKFVNN